MQTRGTERKYRRSPSVIMPLDGGVDGDGTRHSVRRPRVGPALMVIKGWQAMASNYHQKRRERTWAAAKNLLMIGSFWGKLSERTMKPLHPAFTTDDMMWSIDRLIAQTFVRSPQLIPVVKMGARSIRFFRREAQYSRCSTSLVPPDPK